MNRIRGVVEAIFTRWFGWLVLIVLTIASLVAATGVSGLMRAELAAATVLPLRLEPGVTTPDRPDRDGAEAVADLLRMWEHAGVPPEPERADPDEPTDGSGQLREASLWPCPRSSAPIVLVGTMVDVAGDWSVGVVQDRTARRTSAVGVGTRVAGVEVVDVERQRLWVLNDGQLECLEPNQEPVQRPVERQDVREASGAGPREQVERQDSRSRPAIVRRNATEYDVDRSVVETMLGDPRTARTHSPEVRQYTDHGPPAGIELHQIRQGSLPQQMGLREGDVLSEVNGQRLTTLQRAVELFDALREQDQVVLTFQRRGRARTVTYRVH